MIPIRDLFEAHLTVSDLRRSMAFYGELLGLQLAQLIEDRVVAFYWLGGSGNAKLGVWEVEAERGEASAQFWLGAAYMEGRGVG